MTRNIKKLALNRDTLRVFVGGKNTSVCTETNCTTTGLGLNQSRAAVCNTKNCTHARGVCAQSVGCPAFTEPGLAC